MLRRGNHLLHPQSGPKHCSHVSSCSHLKCSLKQTQLYQKNMPNLKIFQGLMMFDGCEILQRLGFFLLDPSDIPTYLGLSEVAGGSKFSSELLPKKKEERSNRKPRVFLRCGRCRNGSMRFKLQIGNSALRRLTPRPWRIMGGQGDGAILEWKRCLHRRFRFLSIILGRFGFCITRPTQICTAEIFHRWFPWFPGRGTAPWGSTLPPSTFVAPWPTVHRSETLSIFDPWLSWSTVASMDFNGYPLKSKFQPIHTRLS